MPAYLLANIRVHDTERYQDYVANVPALIAKHGGKYRVRGGEAEVLEGEWSPDRFVVIAFPNRAAALAFYDGPDYKPYRTLRQSLTESNVILVDGCG
jgi:uncharacterized protein (DUF1330 family)